MRRHAVAGDVGDVARFLPAVVQQAARLVIGAVQSVALFKEAVVVHHPAVGHPTELCRQRKPLPCESRAEAACPRGVERLSGHNLVAFVKFGGQFAVLGIPQGIAVGGVHAGVAVQEIFVYGMSHDEFQSGGGVYVLLHAVVQFHQLVLVVGHVGVEVPGEIFGAYDVAVDRHFHAPVHHRPDIVPAVALAGNGIAFGYGHQHVGGFLVIEVDVEVDAVEEAQAQPDVVGPGLFPAQLFVAALFGVDTGFVVILRTAGNECQVVVVGYFRVARCTGAECDLCSRQPFDVFQERFVLDVPHKAERPEHTPAVVFAETRGGVGTYGHFAVIQVFVVIFAAKEEREVGVCTGGVVPGRGARTGADVRKEVVGLSFRYHLETAGLVVHGLLPQHEVERVVFVQCPAIVGGGRLAQFQHIRRVASGGTLLVVDDVAWERLHESGGVRVVRAELYAYGQVLYRGDVCEYGGEYFVFLVAYRVVCHPFDGVLSRARPCAVVLGCQRTVFVVRAPVGEHEARAGYRRINRHVSLFRLLHFLVGRHRACAYLQPVAGFHFGIGTHVVTAEGRVLGNTVLVVESARNVVVQSFGGAVHGEFVVLQRCAVVENLFQPVDVGA